MNSTLGSVVPLAMFVKMVVLGLGAQAVGRVIVVWPSEWSEWLDHQCDQSAGRPSDVLHIPKSCNFSRGNGTSF